jgi:uncharacterized glyoxalase superfamily protein PhnB
MMAAGFTVSDLEASLHWYRDVVGFTVGEIFEREGTKAGAELLAGTIRMFIGQDDWAKGRDRVKGIGTRIHLTTAQDVDELANGIKARGGSLDSEPEDMPWGARAFSLTDPDGFQFTISSEF